MRGQATWTAARVTRDRETWVVEMQVRRERDMEARMRLESMGEGITGLKRGRMRKQNTERQSREKAERWWSNLLARQTELNMAALRDICQETGGAVMP